MKNTTKRCIDLVVRVEYQSIESTGFPYLYCHGCGTEHRDAMLIEGTATPIQPDVVRWLRLCADCIDEIIRVGKENQRG